MALISVLCPHGHSDHVLTGGTTQAGTQRDTCHNAVGPCEAFPRDLRSTGRSPETQEHLIDMARNGSGIGDTARV